MKTLRFLFASICVFAVTSMDAAEPRKRLDTNNDIEMEQTLPDYGLKSLVPGVLQIDVEQSNRIVSVEFVEAPFENVSIRVERANGQVVLDESVQVAEGQTIVLNRMRYKGEHKLFITDGRTKYQGTFNVK